RRPRRGSVSSMPDRDSSLPVRPRPPNGREIPRELLYSALPVARPRADSEGRHMVIQEFKEFISRGNVIDLAVGIIIGAAFTGIVNSLINDILLPPIGWALGNLDFSNYFITLSGG